MKALHNTIWIIPIVSALAIAGFEIGNGRRLVKNAQGGYELKVPGQFEVGLAGKFTEVVAPLSSGTPRTRLQINVVEDSALKELEIECRSDGSCEKIQLGELSGLKKLAQLPTRLKQVEFRLSANQGKTILVNLEGVPSGAPNGAFETAVEAISSLKLIEAK